MSRVTKIGAHDITLEYCDWTEFQLNHYNGPIYRTIYVVHTDDDSWDGAPHGYLPAPQSVDDFLDKTYVPLEDT